MFSHTHLYRSCVHTEGCVVPGQAIRQCRPPSRQSILEADSWRLALVSRRMGVVVNQDSQRIWAGPAPYPHERAGGQPGVDSLSSLLLPLRHQTASIYQEPAFLTNVEPELMNLWSSFFFDISLGRRRQCSLRHRDQSQRPLQHHGTVANLHYSHVPCSHRSRRCDQGASYIRS